MQRTDPRFQKEQDTLKAMIGIYCRDHHGGHDVCAECTNLLDYALQRLEKCPFGPDKPKCSACKVHCYRHERREQIREVMKYAGPRMVTRHPMMAARHIWDGIVHRPGKRES